jgi:hypothetical protein
MMTNKTVQDTSGVLLLARRQSTARDVSQLFKNKTRMAKTYWAFVLGHPQPRTGRITTFLKKEKVGKGDEKMVIKNAPEGCLFSSFFLFEIDPPFFFFFPHFCFFHTQTMQNSQ